MKKYITPAAEIVELDSSDILTASRGTETSKYEENDGIWDLNVN